jgi:hypothetical protein
MKWFDQWFAKKVKQAWDTSQDEPEEVYSTMSNAKVSRRGINTIRARDENDLPEGGLNIQVKSAHGGKIVIFRTYDERNDRNLYTTYLIHDSENFESSLGKIITMESLKL